MSDYNELTDVYANLNDQAKDTARQTRPRALTTFRRESNASNFSQKTDNSSDKRKLSVIRNDTETQTDWSWIQDMELINKIRREGAEIFEEIVDELVQTSDSESEPEVRMPSPTPKPQPIVESVGPPKILQFNSEIKKTEITPREPSPPLSIDSDPIDNLGQFMQDFNIHIKGGQKCEFCGDVTKPWPTINKQEQINPENLHCCTDYQEFVEALIQYQIEKEEANKQYIMDRESRKNEIKNVKARKLAEERAELRNMQRMLEKHKRMERIENLRLEKQQLQQQLQAKQLNIKNNEQNQDLEHNYESNSSRITTTKSRHDHDLHSVKKHNHTPTRNSKLESLSLDETSTIVDTPLSFNENSTKI